MTEIDDAAVVSELLGVPGRPAFAQRDDAAAVVIGENVSAIELGQAIAAIDRAAGDAIAGAAIVFINRLDGIENQRFLIA